MIYPLSDAKSFAFGDITGRDYGVPSSDFTLSHIAIDGAKARVKNTVSYFVFHIQSGAGSFEVDRQWFDVKAGDVVYVPKAVPYAYKGKMEFLEFMAPAYQEGAEVPVE